MSCLQKIPARRGSPPLVVSSSRRHSAVESTPNKSARQRAVFRHGDTSPPSVTRPCLKKDWAKDKTRTGGPVLHCNGEVPGGDQPARTQRQAPRASINLDARVKRARTRISPWCLMTPAPCRSRSSPGRANNRWAGDRHRHRAHHATRCSAEALGTSERVDTHRDRGRRWPARAASRSRATAARSPTRRHDR